MHKLKSHAQFEAEPLASLRDDIPADLAAVVSRMMAKDPDGFKKDMEKMCKAMFGDNWEVEYNAMLREEFPEEFED